VSRSLIFTAVKCSNTCSTSLLRCKCCAMFFK
jgi:hypothetical protein